MIELREKVEEYFKDAFEVGSVDGDYTNIDNAVYTISELGLWWDEIDSISPNQAFMVYNIVKKVLKDGFPEHLRI